MPTSVSVSTSLRRLSVVDELDKALDANTHPPSHGEGSRRRIGANRFSIRSLSAGNFSRHGKYAETNDNWHHRSHRFPAYVSSPFVSLVTFAFDISLPVRTGATGSKFSASINLCPGSFFIRWAHPFQPQARSSSAPVLLHACAYTVPLSPQMRCARRPRFPRRRAQSNQGVPLSVLQI